MITSTLRLWPGAILTFFYLVLFLTSAKVEASDASPSPGSQDGHVRIKLDEKAPPPLRTPLAQAPPLRLRDPHLLGLLGGGKKKEATTVTVTNAVTMNATIKAVQTVFVTMPAETVTAMMMMTVTAPAPDTTPAAADPNTAPATAAAAQLTSTDPNTPQGMASVLTLGFLSSGPSTLASVAVEEAIVTPDSTPTSTVFAIATETATLFVTNDDAIATGTIDGMTMASTTGTMKSEAMSGKQAGTRCMGFGAFVVAIWVAVLIL